MTWVRELDGTKSVRCFPRPRHLVPALPAHLQHSLHVCVTQNRDNCVESECSPSSRLHRAPPEGTEHVACLCIRLSISLAVFGNKYVAMRV